MVLMTLLLACGEKEAECSEELACEFGSVCVEGVCQEIPCSTSAQCGMEEYCLDRQCVAGCAEDNDCYPGDLCNTTVNECESGGCRDTQLDCGFKEFCNPANAECYEVDGYYCKPCTSDASCGGEESGNICLNFGGGYQYCGVECASDNDCPAGFGCLPVGDFNGNVYTFQCATYCWLYDDEDRDMAAPPRPTGLDLFPTCLQDEGLKE